MSKKTLIVAPIAVVIALIGIFYFAAEPNQESIKIGATLSLTGPTNALGLENLDGMLMAIDEINSSGGINGRPIELIILDNQSTAEKAKENFLELENTHAPLMYVSSMSTISFAVSQLAEEHEVVLMALSATATGITVDKEWTYRYFPTAVDEAYTITRILDGLNVYNFGILYIDDSFGISVADEIETVSQHPDRTATRESFGLETSDFKDHITNLQNTNAIVIVTFPEYVQQILNDIREVNYQGHVIGSSDFLIRDIESIPEANGVYFATPSMFDPTFEFAVNIGENFESRYDKPFDHNSANGYDFIKLLEGLLEGEELSRDNIKQILDEGYSHLGAFGNIHVSPGEHDIAFPLSPAQIIDGKLEFKK